jgi:hypothetical protein
VRKGRSSTARKSNSFAYNVQHKAGKFYEGKRDMKMNKIIKNSTNEKGDIKMNNFKLLIFSFSLPHTYLK